MCAARALGCGTRRGRPRPRPRFGAARPTARRLSARPLRRAAREWRHPPRCARECRCAGAWAQERQASQAVGTGRTYATASDGRFRAHPRSPQSRAGRASRRAPSARHWLPQSCRARSGLLSPERCRLRPGSPRCPPRQLRQDRPCWTGP